MEQQQNYEFKIVLIGIENVGKSSILSKYVSNTFTEDYNSTIGA